ncbi:MAG TPA: DNA polymerase III subunit beta [Candidatus Bipolaricaulota bacterium]|nr:DNA polymerase III subunit beta [Candidatus Bipolaricaulota bacterium]
MKFICTQENLNRGLFITGHLSNKNVNLPILNNVLLKVTEGALTLASTNLEIGISATVRGKLEKEGEFTVESRLISDFVSLLPNEKVELLLDKDDYLKVSTSNSKTRIKGLPATDFPVIPKIEKDDPYIVNIKDLQKAISQVIFAVSTNESRPEISGVFMSLHSENNKLTLAATDSYRLAEKKVDISGNKNKKELIVPVKTFQELLRILTALKDDPDGAENIEIFITENQILFSLSSGIEIISRTVEGQYPDYKQIIPNENKTKVTVETPRLLKTIKTTSLFSKTGIFDINLEFLDDKKSLVVSSTNNQLGESVSEMEVDFHGDKNQTVINYRYLLDGLNNLDSDNVSLEIIDGNVPLIIRPAEDTGYLYIIMPIKQ